MTHPPARSASKRLPFDIDVALFYAVMAVAAIFGGSSRYDMVQNILLQPLLWLLLGVVAMRRVGNLATRPYLLLSLAYGLYLALQLVPLPFSVWSELPGRQAIVDLDLALIGESARPFSLVPARTLNALANLPAILAPLIAFSNIRERAIFHGVCAIVSCVVLSGMLGLAQFVTGEGYFYSITNLGSMVGLFANANHAAVYGSCGIVIASCAAICARSTMHRSILWAAAIFLFLATIGNGSRAGLVTLAMAVLVSLLLAYLNMRKKSSASSFSKQWLAIGAIFLLAIGTLGAFFATGRVAAFDDLVNADPFGDLRFAIAPLLIDMIWEFFPLGSGIGTFEETFYMFETDELLQPNYVNMAHNDWLQLLIEGGLIGALFLLAFIGLFSRTVVGAAKRFSGGARLSIVPAVLTFLAILALASAFDYPLRTPLFQATVAVLVAILASIARPVSPNDAPN